MPGLRFGSPPSSVQFPCVLFNVFLYENVHVFIGSDNGLVPTRRQAIISTNDGYYINAYLRDSASMSYTTNRTVMVQQKIFNFQTL